MNRRLEMLGIIVAIALRNLFASRLKTLIVGGIIGFGSLLVVVGTSLLDSVNDGMARSIIGSAAGHLQVYNAESKDDLALYGGMTGEPDIRPMEDFSRVKKTLLSVPNVKRVVPMGVAEAMASSGNELDFALERLREAVKRRQADPASVSDDRFAALKDHVRQMVVLLQNDARGVSQMVEDKAIDPQGLEDVTRAAGDAFWAGFDAQPLDALEFLENKIAPQSVDGDFIFVRYIGTDLDTYAQAFDRMQILEGTAVPKGQRGILFGKLYYEEWIKLKTALRLDKIKEAREVNHKLIAKDEELQRFVKENVKQVREIVVQLDSIARREMVARLQKALGSTEGDVSRLLEQLLATDDQNFDARYATYYADVAPLVKLYRIRPGDTITIKAFTKSGYVKSVNVKLYGIYAFKGLEKSGFAGLISLLDLMSFRDLYGFLTADKLEEIKQLRLASGAKQVDRASAEDELFGDAKPLIAETKAGAFDELAGLEVQTREALDRHVYTPEEIDRGVALNAAILLEDPSKSKETAAAIAKALERDGLKLKVVDWQKAAGMVGQLINILSLVLVTVVLIIFLIALVIINNSMVMATLQRVKEIGTLRAIGAQRRFVLVMIGIETIVIGAFFGTIGSALGALVVEIIGRIGIPATTQETQFIFSGPRLHPYLSGSNLIAALAIVLVVSILSSFYPAILATRVTPLEAMQSDD